MNRKFMQTLDDFHFNWLNRIAKHRGSTVQQLIRAVIVPEWLEARQQKERKKRLRKWLGRGS